MQWNDSDNAGFTTGKPWLRCNDNYKEINVENQVNDPESVLSYYKELIKVRKNEALKDALVYGEFVPVFEENETVLAFYRKGEENTVMVLLNFGAEEEQMELEREVKEVLLSNMNRTACESKLTLAPCEALVLLVK